MIVPMEGGEEVGPFAKEADTHEFIPEETFMADLPKVLSTTADLDARDHFASEVRALHPTQLDRIEKKLDRVLEILEYHLG